MSDIEIDATRHLVSPLARVTKASPFPYVESLLRLLLVPHSAQRLFGWFGGSGIAAQACRAEGRVLITLDRDFGQVLRFPPADTSSIVILDLFPQALLVRLQAFLAVPASWPLTGTLWIVEPGRVRIHLTNGEEGRT